jgi:hypothetical protein
MRRSLPLISLPAIRNRSVDVSNRQLPVQGRFGACGWIKNHGRFSSTYAQDRTLDAEGVAGQYQSDPGSGQQGAIDVKLCTTDRQVDDLNEPRVPLRAKRMEQGLINLGRAHAWEATSIPDATGLHCFGFGIQVERNLQQHSRKSNVVSGLGQFPRARGSLSEMGGVQGDLLFRSQDRDISDPTAITSWRVDDIPALPDEVFSGNLRGAILFAALFVASEG